MSAEPGIPILEFLLKEEKYDPAAEAEKGEPGDFYEIVR